MAINEPSVKGLLGKGKTRVVFNITLNMARAQILLMNEDETKLAVLSQDNLLTDIKVRSCLFVPHYLVYILVWRKKFTLPNMQSTVLSFFLVEIPMNGQI